MPAKAIAPLGGGAYGGASRSMSSSDDGAAGPLLTRP